MMQHIATTYSRAANKAAGISLLRDHIESSLILNNAIGKKTLTVGANNASLMLLNNGFQVTGVDSSQTKRDEYRSMVGDNPMLILKTGDIAKIPETECIYDTLIALNVLTHVSCWKEALQEWSRVVREGGRVIFDAHSLDHAQWILKRDVGQEELQRNNVADYKSYLAVKDVLDTADQLGLSVVAIIPYGAFLDGYDDTFIYPSPILGRFYWWQRLLSWMIYDQQLFDMAALIEQEIISHLPSVVTNRYMVVLEKREGTESNQSWREKNECAMRAIINGDICNVISVERPALRTKLSKLLFDGPRNIRYLTALNRGLMDIGLRLELGDFLSDEGQFVLKDIESKSNLDRHALDMVERWHQMPEIDELMTVGGVPLADITNYKLITPILILVLKAFPRLCK